MWQWMLKLPQIVVNVPLNVDGERTVAGDLHRRVGDFTASLHRRRDSRFDVVY